MMHQVTMIEFVHIILITAGCTVFWMSVMVAAILLWVCHKSNKASRRGI